MWASEAWIQATPGPFIGACAEAGADGVEEDVVERRGQVLVRLDDPGGVPVAPHVAPAFVPSVEGERVDPVETVHPASHLVHRRREHEVVVRRHQAVGVEVPVEAVDAVPEEGQKAAAVEPVVKDRAVVDPERGDVEDAVRQRSAKDAGD